MESDEVPNVSQVSLEVPDLGTLKGISLNKSTCQYLGIPYADIPGRFRRSKPAAAPWKNGQWDGTKLGPYCPQPPRDFYPVPNPSRPWLAVPHADEFNCLNLNISVPHLPTEGGEPLPVMVFIHGGAFTYAMNSSPIYDSRILADSSAHHFSKPTIIVTINYRLGVYGFMAGRDIQQYNSANGEEGVGNYGVWDQVLALRWVQQHISSFGGDPKRVTLFGQSAGAASVHAHLLRDEPLFSSAILQSGLIRLCGAMSIDQHQVVFERLLTTLNIPLELSHEERMDKILAVETSDLTQAMIPTYIIPVITSSLCDDEALVPGPMETLARYSEFKAPPWCPRIMIGDAKNECIIWNKSWENLSESLLGPSQDLSIPLPSKTIAKMEAFLGIHKTRKIAELYGISESMDSDALFVALERMTSHGMYSAPIYLTQQAAKHSILAYHFEVPSPYENAWGGLSHHSFDNVLIWGILKHTLPPTQQKIGEEMMEAWITFANGQDPWEKLSENGKWKVFGPQGSSLKSKEEDSGRGFTIWDELQSLGLIKDLVDLSDELCIRRSELTKLSPSA